MKKLFTTLTIISVFFFFTPIASATSNPVLESEQHPYGGSGTQTTQSMTFTSAGSNDVLIGFLNSGNAGTDIHATSATWNGVSLTQVGTTQTGGINGTINMWILVNPAIGTYNLVTNWSASVTGYGAAAAFAVFSGASATQPDAYTSPTNQNPDVSVSVTTVAANSVVILLSNAGGTAGANTTQIQAAIGWTGYRNATTAGAYTVAESTGAITSGAGAISLAPYVAPVSTPISILGLVWSMWW